MPDISNISLKAVSLGNLILVSPQSAGYQPAGQPTFLFDFEGEQTITLESDVTDHYTEDNTALQDQISKKPVMVTTHGYIGELNNVPPAALAALKAVADKLTALAPFAPQLSLTATLAYNRAAQAYAVASSLATSAVNTWSALTGGNAQNKQQAAFNKFYGYWNDRTLFKVFTPWAAYDNMVIKTLRAVQDEETRMVTNFEITFKQMRFINTNSNISASTDFQGRAAAQMTTPSEGGLGIMTPSESVLDKLTASGLGAA